MLHSRAGTGFNESREVVWVDTPDSMRQAALHEFYDLCNTVEDHDPEFAPRFTEAFLNGNMRVIEACNL